MKRSAWLVLVLGLVHCGGSTDADGSGGSSGTAGSGGSSGSGGAGGNGGTAGTGGTGGIDFFSCNVTSECLLRSESCCGSCGAATRDDSIAINQSKAGQYTQMVCEGGGCPACFMPQDPTLLATCESSQCQVVDLLNHPSTACQTDSDCRVRTTDCCECGGSIEPDHLVAISVNGDAQFSALVCDPNVACPECAPAYPPAKVACISGHCTLVTGN